MKTRVKKSTAMLIAMCFALTVLVGTATYMFTAKAEETPIGLQEQ